MTEDSLKAFVMTHNMRENSLQFKSPSSCHSNTTLKRSVEGIRTTFEADAFLIELEQIWQD